MKIEIKGTDAQSHFPLTVKFKRIAKQCTRDLCKYFLYTNTKICTLKLKYFKLFYALYARNKYYISLHMFLICVVRKRKVKVISAISLTSALMFVFLNNGTF